MMGSVSAGATLAAETAGAVKMAITITHRVKVRKYFNKTFVDAFLRNTCRCLRFMKTNATVVEFVLHFVQQLSER